LRRLSDAVAVSYPIELRRAAPEVTSVDAFDLPAVVEIAPTECDDPDRLQYVHHVPEIHTGVLIVDAEIGACGTDEAGRTKRIIKWIAVWRELWKKRINVVAQALPILSHPTAWILSRIGAELSKHLVRRRPITDQDNGVRRRGAAKDKRQKYAEQDSRTNRHRLHRRPFHA